MNTPLKTAGAYYKRPTMGASLPYWLHRARQWHIEYGGFLSNHIAHNWVALSGLGADDARMKRWEELYANQLDEQPAREPGYLEPARMAPQGESPLTEANWRDRIQSTREAFPAYRDFFDRQIAVLGVGQTIRRYAPTLLRGLAGAALHPVIHAGWGADAASTVMTAEGLAYMATAFQPLATDSRHGFAGAPWTSGAPGIIAATRDFIANARAQGLSRVADDASKTPAYRQMGKGEFQARVIAFEDPALPLGAALNRVGPLRLPAVGEPLQEAIEEATAMLAAALDASHDEFFVLHGLTSLHAVLVLMTYLDEAAQRDALAYWWRATMAAFVAQDLPGADGTLERLERWRSEHRAGERYRLTAAEREWFRATLPHTFPSLDEHVPKAAYVLWRWCEWEAFSPATVALFLTAARHITQPHPSGKIHENLTFGRAFSDASRAKMTDRSRRGRRAFEPATVEPGPTASPERTSTRSR